MRLSVMPAVRRPVAPTVMRGSGRAVARPRTGMRVGVPCSPETGRRGRMRTVLRRRGVVTLPPRRVLAAFAGGPFPVPVRPMAGVPVREAAVNSRAEERVASPVLVPPRLGTGDAAAQAQRRRQQPPDPKPLSRAHGCPSSIETPPDTGGRCPRCDTAADSSASGPFALNGRTHTGILRNPHHGPEQPREMSPDCRGRSAYRERAGPALAEPARGMVSSVSGRSAGE